MLNAAHVVNAESTSSGTISRTEPRPSRPRTVEMTPPQNISDDASASFAAPACAAPRRAQSAHAAKHRAAPSIAVAPVGVPLAVGSLLRRRRCGAK
eukprot:7001447-Prymnesium_polylepis.1